MMQFWTPLAKIFGLAEKQKSDQPKTDLFYSSWPDLFSLLHKYATTYLIEVCRRHKEVSLDDVMSIRRLTIGPSDDQIQSQLSSWIAEGSNAQLINWIINGPWNTKEIHHYIDFSDFTELDFVHFPEDSIELSRQNNPYDDQKLSGHKHKDTSLQISVDFTWVDRSKKTLPIEPLTEPQVVRIVIDDANGSRNLFLDGNIFIFGTPKTLSWVNEKISSFADGIKIDWSGEPAMFVAIEGRQVSGTHLAVRRNGDGLDFQDLNSVNGTFHKLGVLQPFLWHAGGNHQKFFLGGSIKDHPAVAPRLHISLINTQEVITSNDQTPLRIQEYLPASFTNNHLAIHLEGTNGWCDEFVIKSLPISIGRSADCDVHIPAEFSKVSRKHVVIREYNYHQGLILLEDVSTNGLIITGGDASKDPRSAAWFGIGSEIIIGASQKSPSVLITFHVR